MFAHLFSHFRGHGVLVGGDGSREKRLEAIVRIFERSFNILILGPHFRGGQDFVVQPPRIC